MIKKFINDFIKVSIVFWFLYVLAFPVWYIISDTYGLFVAFLLINIPLGILTVQIISNEKESNARK